MLWLQRTDSSAPQNSITNFTSLFHRKKTRDGREKINARKDFQHAIQAEHVLEHPDRKPRVIPEIVTDLRHLDALHQASNVPSPTSIVSKAESSRAYVTGKQGGDSLRPREYSTSIASVSSSVGSSISSTKATSINLIQLGTASSDAVEEYSRNESREAHAKMLEAFDAALDKSRQEKLDGPSQTRKQEKRPSSYAAPTGKELPTKETSGPNTNMRAARPIYRRQRSLSMRLLTQHSLAASGREHFSTIPLPPLPAESSRTAWRKCQFRLPGKAVRRQVLQSKTTQPDVMDGEHGLSRRLSCPQIHSLNKADSHEAPIDPDEDLFFAAGCTIRWLFNGRRFCDSELSDILNRPGASCLSLERPVMDFDRDFPHATEELFESIPPGGDFKDQPRYTNLPYEDNSFDVISGRSLSASIVSQDWPAALSELKRVLRPGGKIELVELSTEWLNAGPMTTAYEQSMFDKFEKLGLVCNVLDNLPKFVHQSHFERIKVAYLAVPIHWGGSVSRLWVHNVEPLAAAYEARVLGHSMESRHKEWKKLEQEIISNRSLKVIMTISATK